MWGAAALWAGVRSLLRELRASPSSALAMGQRTEDSLIVIRAGWIDVLNPWGEEDGRSECLDEGAVLVEDAGIGLEVGLIVELGRVDEVGYHYGIALGDCPADKGGVSLVEGAHCRNESYCFVSKRLACGLEVRQGFSCVHDFSEIGGKHTYFQ